MKLLRKELEVPTDWEAFRARGPEMLVNEIIAACDVAYARYLAGE